MGQLIVTAIGIAALIVAIYTLRHIEKHKPQH